MISACGRGISLPDLVDHTYRAKRRLWIGDSTRQTHEKKLGLRKGKSRTFFTCGTEILCMRPNVLNLIAGT